MTPTPEAPAETPATPSDISEAEIGRAHTAHLVREASASARTFPAETPDAGVVTLETMAERLRDHLEGAWGYELGLYDIKLALADALTGLPPGPERDAAVTSVMAALARSSAVAPGVPTGVVREAALAGLRRLRAEVNGCSPGVPSTFINIPMGEVRGMVAALEAALDSSQADAGGDRVITVPELLTALNAKGFSYVATIKDVQDVDWEIRHGRLGASAAPASGVPGVEALVELVEKVLRRGSMGVGRYRQIPANMLDELRERTDDVLVGLTAAGMGDEGRDHSGDVTDMIATPPTAPAQPLVADGLRVAVQAVVGDDFVRRALADADRSNEHTRTIGVELPLLRGLETALATSSSDRGGATGGWSFDLEAAKQSGVELDLWLSEDEGPGYRRTNLHWGYPQHTCGEAGRFCDNCPPNEEGWLTELEGFAFEEGEAQNVVAWRVAPAPPATSEG